MSGVVARKSDTRDRWISWGAGSGASLVRSPDQGPGHQVSTRRSIRPQLGLELATGLTRMTQQHWMKGELVSQEQPTISFSSLSSETTRSVPIPFVSLTPLHRTRLLYFFLKKWCFTILCKIRTHQSIMKRGKVKLHKIFGFVSSFIRFACWYKTLKKIDKQEKIGASRKSG